MGSAWRADRATSWLRSRVATELLPIFAVWDCGPILPDISIFQEEPNPQISRSKPIMCKSMYFKNCFKFKKLLQCSVPAEAGAKVGGRAVGSV